MHIDINTIKECSTVPLISSWSVCENASLLSLYLIPTFLCFFCDAFDVPGRLPLGRFFENMSNMIKAQWAICIFLFSIYFHTTNGLKSQDVQI